MIEEKCFWWEIFSVFSCTCLLLFLRGVGRFKKEITKEIKNVSKWGLLWWSRKCLQVTIDRKYLLNRKTCNLLFTVFITWNTWNRGCYKKKLTWIKKPHLNNYNHTNNYNIHLPNRKTCNLPFHSLLNEKWVYRTD